MNRQLKKENIRENIIQALYELLKGRTFENLSSKEICEKAGVSKRTLYIYFRSQDEMYLELVRRSFKHMVETFEQDMMFETTIEDKICNIGERYLCFLFDHPTEGELIIGYDEKRYVEAFPELVGEISTIANEYELLHIFRKWKLDPEIYDSNLAIFLWAYIQGIAQLLVRKEGWMEGYYGMPIQKIIKDQIHFVRIMLRGVIND